ncbi:MAG: PDZ domain-containing protein, partial [Clostridia bacterium]|nr:PDZ domain-containing protein [Clostridia bacterium]
MKKSQFGKFIWNALPVFAIILIAAVLVTWQITHNYVTKSMETKYDSIINGVTSTNDISTMIYNVDSVIRSEYLGTVDEKKLVDGTIAGYIYGLGDKYASYMTEEQYNKYITDNLEGEKFTGIGISCVFDTEAGGLYIVSIYNNTPAAKAGLSHGEVITKIDGSSVTDVGYDAALEMIAAKSIGNTVNVTVRSIEGTERNVPMMIEQVTIDTVRSRMLNKDTGLIKISEFSGTTPDEFKKAIENLINSGAERFVFDVRNNPGG